MRFQSNVTTVYGRVAEIPVFRSAEGNSRLDALGPQIGVNSSPLPNKGNLIKVIRILMTSYCIGYSLPTSYA